MNLTTVLERLRQGVGEAQTVGLPAETIEKHFKISDGLRSALDGALKLLDDLPLELKRFRGMSEKEAISEIQHGVLNFYNTDDLTTYIPLSAKGPWIVTLHGAVVFLCLLLVLLYIYIILYICICI